MQGSTQVNTHISPSVILSNSIILRALISLSSLLEDKYFFVRFNRFASANETAIDLFVVFSAYSPKSFNNIPIL